MNTKGRKYSSKTGEERKDKSAAVVNKPTKRGLGNMGNGNNNKRKKQGKSFRSNSNSNTRSTSTSRSRSNFSFMDDQEQQQQQMQMQNIPMVSTSNFGGGGSIYSTNYTSPSSSRNSIFSHSHSGRFNPSFPYDNSPETIPRSKPSTLGPDPSSFSQPDPTKRKQCRCKNSKCLKLYCECFTSRVYCNEDCNCCNCLNNESNEQSVINAINTTLERNPSAFKPKINANSVVNANANVSNQHDDILSTSKVALRHIKGCHCSKSGCLKRYCECFQANVRCSDMCKCKDCKNYEGSKELLVINEMKAEKLNYQPPENNSQTEIYGNEVLPGDSPLTYYPSAGAPSYVNQAAKAMNVFLRQSVISNLCRVLLQSAKEEEKVHESESKCISNDGKNPENSEDCSSSHFLFKQHRSILCTDESLVTTSDVSDSLYSRQEEAALAELAAFLRQSLEISRRHCLS